MNIGDKIEVKGQVGIMVCEIVGIEEQSVFVKHTVVKPEGIELDDGVMTAEEWTTLKNMAAHPALFQTREVPPCTS